MAHNLLTPTTPPTAGWSTLPKTSGKEGEDGIIIFNHILKAWSLTLTLKNLFDFQTKKNFRTFRLSD